MSVYQPTVALSSSTLLVVAKTRDFLFLLAVKLEWSRLDRFPINQALKGIIIEPAMNIFIAWGELMLYSASFIACNIMLSGDSLI